MRRWWSLLTIRTRLTIWYTATLGFILIAFSGSVYLFLQRSLYERLDEQLEEDFDLAVEILDVDAHGDVTVRGDRSFDENIFRHERRWLEVLDKDSQRLLFPSQPVMGELHPLCTTGRPSHYTQGSLRIYCTPVSLGLKHTIVRVGRSEKILRYELRELLAIFGLFLPIAILGTGLGGLFLSNRLLRPIDEIVNHARGISAKHLSQRIQVANEGDELGRLASVINDTFERLEKAFTNMKRFTADASHELRTPLTSLRATAEVALMKDAHTEEARNAISSMWEDAMGMSRIVDSLLMLSRIDSDQIALQKNLEGLHAAIEESIAPLKRRAADQGIAIETITEENAVVFCDKSLFVHAVRNLVQNAIHFSDRGQKVTIAAQVDGDQVIVNVQDSGKGIAADDLSQVFERFYRVDKSRSREHGGAGLGLALVKWIVESHDGEVTVTSQLGIGSKFTISIPTRAD